MKKFHLRVLSLSTQQRFSS